MPVEAVTVAVGAHGGLGVGVAVDGLLDGERAELVVGAPGEPTVQLLQMGGAGVGVAVAGQERAGTAVQTKLGLRVEDTVVAVTGMLPGAARTASGPPRTQDPTATVGEPENPAASCTQ